jgi:ribosomal protein S18 acetylase RimI-like enzyme
MKISECAALSRQGVPGVRLGVGARNAGGIAFYRKVGFITLREEAWGFVMGKRLQSSAHAD